MIRTAVFKMLASIFPTGASGWLRVHLPSFARVDDLRGRSASARGFAAEQP